MAEFGVPPEDTLMVGDTTFDMEMAVNAGARALGVSWGYHARRTYWPRARSRCLKTSRT
jgi:phosphoglycolate phosphatase-like HAD superfamily hydrolase